METTCMYSVSQCPLLSISWLWFGVAVVVTYALGALWYGKLFLKPWLECVEYKCPCGADMSKGEKCECKHSALPMIGQFIATVLVGLMIFALAKVSLCITFLVIIAVSGWMKATLMFKTPKFKTYVKLASIEVGYFFVCCIIFLLFSLIKCC